jgi:hypothetical protein
MESDQTQPGQQGTEEGCCDGDKCCSEDQAGPSYTTIVQTASAGGCCSGGAASAKLRSTDVLAAEEEAGAFEVPPCHCGPNCSCPGCLSDNSASMQERLDMERKEECPDKCSACSACVYGLTRPSGIEAVDEWMEKDKQNNKRANEADESISNKAPKRAQTLPSSSVPFSPPFPNAANFFSSHFLDPERRRYFADQLQGAQSEPHQDTPQPLAQKENLKYGQRREGESDEDWQVRHGFYYLTPEAIQIFDSARKFKEERELADRQLLLDADLLNHSSRIPFRSKNGRARGTISFRRRE